MTAMAEQPLPDAEQETRARALMKEIRCLVCQNQSIEDSDAGLAKDLRAIVRERITAGDTDQEIKDFLVARYGDWVLMKPPLNLGTLFLWGSPLLLLVVGLGFAFLRGGKSGAEKVSPLSSEEEELLKAALAEEPAVDGTDNKQPSTQQEQNK